MTVEAPARRSRERLGGGGGEDGSNKVQDAACVISDASIFPSL